MKPIKQELEMEINYVKKFISDPASAYVHVCEAHIAQIWIDICACM
jgi:hypothetical protein